MDGYLPTAGAYVNMAGGLLMSALGVFTLLRGPRTRGHWAFAAFGVGLGLVFVAGNLVMRPHPHHGAWSMLSQALMPPTAIAVALLALWSPKFEAPMRARVVAPAVGVGLGYLVLALPELLGFGELVTNVLLFPGFYFAIVLLTQRFRYAEGPDAVRRDSYALVAAALLVFPAAAAGFRLSREAPGSSIEILLLGAICILWLRNTSGVPRAFARTARNVAILIPAVVLAGYVTRLAAGGSYEADWEWGVPGIARAVSMALLAYAVVRHEWLGLDLKVRWTFRQSTLAALFIAVFFVVSELTAKVLSDQTGDVIGILATGMLLFWLAPLQRLAERASVRAVPVTSAAPEPKGKGPQAVYYRASLQAWADGAVSPDERRMLDDLQVSLGITGGLAMNLEKQAFGASPATGDSKGAAV